MQQSHFSFGKKPNYHTFNKTPQNISVKFIFKEGKGGQIINGDLAPSLRFPGVFITKARNLFPQVLLERNNFNQKRAIFAVCADNQNNEIKVAEVKCMPEFHCIIHPNWKKNFDANCDIACLTQNNIPTALDKMRECAREQTFQAAETPILIDNTELRRMSGITYDPKDLSPIIYYFENNFQTKCSTISKLDDFEKECYAYFLSLRLGL